ncbi:MAG: hypothetical protein ACQETH_02140 [Candidatus Rifleibacteriota bacterium]
MNIFKFKDFLHHWFISKGIQECPGFPAALSDGWHHPDILLNIFKKEPVSFCVFQTMARKQFCPSGNSHNLTTGIIWLVKPYSPQFLDIFSEFLLDIQQELYGDKSSQRFIIEGQSPEIGELLERGGAYRVFFNGIETGECRVFSAVAGESLAEPVAVVTIDFGRILQASGKDAALDEPEWQSQTRLSEFAAFQAFFKPEFISTMSIEEVLSEIDKLEKNKKISEFQRINALLRLYNSTRATFKDCQKVRDKFCLLLKNTGQAFRSSCSKATEASG